MVTAEDLIAGLLKGRLRFLVHRLQRQATFVPLASRSAPLMPNAVLVAAQSAKKGEGQVVLVSVVMVETGMVQEMHPLSSV